MKRRTIIYGVVFSIASYATAAVLALSVGAYAVSSFTDPIVTLTLPLILISIGVQAMNEKYSVLFLALVNALLYAAIGLLFMVPTFIIAGMVDEVISWFVGYRSFKAVMINTTVVGTLAGFFSTLFGIFMVGIVGIIPFNDLLLAFIVFTVIYLAESAVMGLVSYKLGSYMIKSGIIKGG